MVSRGSEESSAHGPLGQPKAGNRAMDGAGPEVQSDTEAVEAARIRELEGRARRGSAEAFGELLRAYDPTLRAVVWNVVRNRDGVDDVLQTAYEKAFRRIDSFDGRASLKSWLYSICYNSAIDYVRYEGRRRHEEVESIPQARQPESMSLGHRSADRVDTAALLSSLGSESRAALYLNVALGYTVDEVAEITDSPRGTVASRIRRAKLALQAEAAA